MAIKSIKKVLPTGFGIPSKIKIWYTLNGEKLPNAMEIKSNSACLNSYSMQKACINQLKGAPPKKAKSGTKFIVIPVNNC